MREFIESRLTPRIRRDAKRWMSRVRGEGCHIVLVSAALEPMVASIAEAMRVDGYTATRVNPDSANGFALAGDMIYGEAKLRALREYADGRFPSWRLEYAFGNAYDDRFLLTEAVHPFAICPETRLATLAEQHGWPRATWR
jgi:phosphoserine phosphatase